MTTYFKTCFRDDGETKVTVEYRVTDPGAAPTWGPDGGDPGWAPEVEFVSVFTTEGDDDVKLTDAEDQRFYEEVVCNHEADDYDAYDPRI